MSLTSVISAEKKEIFFTCLNVGDIRKIHIIQIHYNTNEKWKLYTTSNERKSLSYKWDREKNLFAYFDWSHFLFIIKYIIHVYVNVRVCTYVCVAVWTDLCSLLPLLFTWNLLWASVANTYKTTNIWLHKTNNVVKPSILHACKHVYVYYT